MTVFDDIDKFQLLFARRFYEESMYKVGHECNEFYKIIIFISKTDFNLVFFFSQRIYNNKMTKEV